MTQTKQTAKTLEELKEKNPKKYPPTNEWYNWVTYCNDNKTKTNKIKNPYPPGQQKNPPHFRTKVVSIRIDETEIPIENKEWKTALKKIMEFYKDDKDFIDIFGAEGYKNLGNKFTTKGCAKLVLSVLIEKNKTDIYFKYEIQELTELENEKKEVNTMAKTNNSKRYFIGGFFWEGENQLGRFVKDGIWENGYGEEKYSELLSKISIGDMFALKSTFRKGGKSFLRIKHIGIVKELKSKSVIRIDWIKNDEFDLTDIKWYANTLEEITEENDIQRIFYKKSEQNDKKNITKKQQPLNQILYGPPGTGKTYSIKEKVNEILNFYTEKQIESLKDLDSSRYKFVTFHPAYGYEEFMEGIRPKTEDKQIEYNVESGCFKLLCEEAKNNFETTKSEPTIDYTKIFYDFLSNYQEQEQEKDFTINFDRDGEFKSFNVKATSEQKLTKKIFLRDIKDIIDGKITEYQNIKPTYQSKSPFHGNAIYYFQVYKKIEQFYRDNSSDYKLELGQKKKLPYFMIIDEINRGNIPKIFGELITLIEEDKRAGAENKISITLPYSQDEFSVPNNVYIIATMNTADKSLIGLDTALRRRFIFKEMMPKPELLDVVDGVNTRQMLIDINSRINRRTHQIGHAYFIKCGSIEDVKKALEYKIIPLLQEYEYYDWNKISEILGIEIIEPVDFSKIANDIVKKYTSSVVIVDPPEEEDSTRQDNLFEGIEKTGKDMSKYLFEGTKYSKRKLALAVIKQHSNINKSSDDILKDFNYIKAGNNHPLFVPKEDGGERHFTKDNEIIELSDGEFAVCNQWDIDSITNFIKEAEKLGYKIEKIND